MSANLGIEVGHAPMSPEPGAVQGTYGIGYFAAGIGWSPDGESALVPKVRMGGGGCCDAAAIAAGVDVDYTFLPKKSPVGLRAGPTLGNLALVRSKEAIAEAASEEDRVTWVGGTLGALIVINDRRGSHGGKYAFGSPDRTITGVLISLGAAHAWGLMSGLLIHGRVAWELHTFEW